MAGGTTGGAIFYRNSRRSWIWGWNEHAESGFDRRKKRTSKSRFVRTGKKERSLQLKLRRPDIEFLKNAPERLKVSITDRKTQHGRPRMTNDHPGDVDQAETELLNPKHSPGRFQMDGFENLDQGVSQKLKLKKDGCGQELFGQDMIDSESVFQFLDDVFRIARIDEEEIREGIGRLGKALRAEFGRSDRRPGR